MHTISIAQITIASKAPTLNITSWIKTQSKDTVLKNKFIIIDFWASWCSPCLASMPHINNLVNKNKDKKNLIFIAMSHENQEKILPILSRITFNASVVNDTTEQTQKNFAITSIPSCIIIDDKGFIQWIGTPEKLTDETIQDILLRKSVTEKIAKKIITDTTEKVYDSIKHEYQKIYYNNNIQEYFAVGPYLKKANGTNYCYKSAKSITKVAIGIKLRDILIEQLSLSSSQISLPTNIENNYISYCYKSGTKTTDEDVLKSLLTTISLTYFKTDSLQKTLVLEVVDSNLLNRFFQKTSIERLSHLSVSSDGKFISMSNSPFSAMLNALQERFGCSIIIKNFTNMNKTLDMMLETDNILSLKKSIKIYGLNIKEVKQVLPFFTFTYK